jgi:hypothetical protein
MNKEDGGSGAAGTVFVGTAAGSNTNDNHNGGGGGGIGFIHINSRAGMATINFTGGTLSPAVAAGSPATVGNGHVN